MLHTPWHGDVNSESGKCFFKLWWLWPGTGYVSKRRQVEQDTLWSLLRRWPVPISSVTVTNINNYRLPGSSLLMVSFMLSSLSSVRSMRVSEVGECLLTRIKWGCFHRNLESWVLKDFSQSTRVGRQREDMKVRERGRKIQSWRRNLIQQFNVAL